MTSPDLVWTSPTVVGTGWETCTANPKLNYIQGMGFDTIWILPVIKNIENKTLFHPVLAAKE